MNNTEKKSTNNLLSITSKPWFITLMFILCYPIAIVLLWTHKKLNKIIRIILTIVFGLWFLIMLGCGAGLKSASFMTCFSEVLKKGEETINKRRIELVGTYFSKNGRYLKLNSDNTFEYYKPFFNDIYRSEKWEYSNSYKLTIDFNKYFKYESKVNDDGKLSFKIIHTSTNKEENWDDFVKYDDGKKSYTKEIIDKMMLNPSEYNIPFGKTGWVQVNSNWNYYQNGVIQKDMFLNDTAIDPEHMYYVDENGNMLTNTLKTTLSGTYEIDANGYAKKVNIKNIWVKKYYVDDFGDKTSEAYFKNSEKFSGTFSNSATTKEKCKFEFAIDKKDVTLFIYEYETLQVKDSDQGYSVSLKTKDGYTVNFNGNLRGDRMYMDSTGRTAILNCLNNGQDFKLYIEEKNRYGIPSTYNFNVEADNFKYVWNS